MRISDWSSDVCSSDLQRQPVQECRETGMRRDDQVDVKGPDRIGQREDRQNPVPRLSACCKSHVVPNLKPKVGCTKALQRLSSAASRSRLLVAEAGRIVYYPRLLMRGGRSVEHTSELESLMRLSY